MATVRLHNEATGHTIDLPAAGSTRRVFEARGYRPVDTATDDDPAQALADAHTRDELAEIARTRGVDPDEYRTKKDLAAALV